MNKIKAFTFFAIFWGISSAILLSDGIKENGFLGYVEQHRYHCWWLIRFFFVVFVLPALMTKPSSCQKHSSDLKEKTNKKWFLYTIYIFLSFTISLSCGQMQNVSWAIWSCAELFQILIGAEYFWISFSENTFKNIYFPITLTILTTPFFLYYLYWEICGKKIPCLLHITPMGMFSSQEITTVLPYFLFLSYPFIYKTKPSILT